MESIRLVKQSDSSIPSIPLSVATRCSGAWHCYDGWGASRATTFVDVTHTYSLRTKCGGSDAFSIESKFAEATFEDRLCYSTDYEDGLDVVVPFDHVADYGEDVHLEVTITSAKSDLYVSLTMEPSQRKTVFIGQFLKAKPKRGTTASFLRQAGLEDAAVDVVPSTAEPFQADLFYDGKNANATALLRVRASQFANVATVSRPGTWFEVFAAIGGANALLWAGTHHLRILYLGATATSVTAAISDCLSSIFG